MKTTPALGAVAAIAALALAGCGAAEPAAESPAASASAEARVPETNEQMKDESARGMAATTYYYFDAVNYALKTGETDLMLSVAADCAECEAAAADISAVYADGGRIEGGQPKAQNVLPLGEVDAQGGLTAVVPLMSDAKTVFAQDGTVVEETAWDSEGTIFTAQGVFEDGAWKIVSLEETPDAELPE
ncbi:DUF6318 family protein [Arthrobacter halodurans]|uniref:DUF6318 family protein n=1 Tax=Arthrobacter halodurans TaxID=516699 RepID=A0ABV4USJ6_9MICC